MPARRISPVAPLLSTATEQKALLALMESRPDVADAVAKVTGETLEGKSKQEKLALFRQYQRAGLAAAPIRQTARILRELVNESQHVDAEDLVTQLTKELTKAQKKIKKLKASLAAEKGNA